MTDADVCNYTVHDLYPTHRSDGTLVARKLLHPRQHNGRLEHHGGFAEQYLPFVDEVVAAQHRIGYHPRIVDEWGIDLRFNRCNAKGDYVCRLPLPTTALVSKLGPRGHPSVWAMCVDCEGYRSYAISHKRLKAEGIDPHGVRVLHDGRRYEWDSCERCGSMDTPTELHHWAPYSLFDDPWAWPTSILCVNCHREWHRTTGCALAHGGPS